MAAGSVSEPQPMVALDYIIFIVILVFVTAQGLWYGCKGGGQKSTQQFLVTSRTTTALPIAMSLLVSFMSPITLLGYPAETYLYGLGYGAYFFAFFWVYPLTAFLFVPVFYGLPLVSAYQYVEWRFNFWTRLLCSILFFVLTAFYIAIVIIGPALAFDAVMGIEIWTSVVFTALICTLYTSLGGMKAVIWTSVFLFIVILLSIFLVLILGTIEAGGISYVWNYNYENDRLNVWYVPFDVTERVTFFNCFIGGGMNFLALLTSQTGIQRFLSSVNLKESQKGVMYNLPFQCVFQPIVYSTGVVMYAYYNNKLMAYQPAVNATFPPGSTYKSYDGHPPRYEPDYTESDQILIYFVSEQFGHIPGFQGLFVSCIFAGALSTVSSLLNAMVAVTLEDYVKPWRQWRAKRTGKPIYVNDKVDTVASKILTVGYGLLALFLSWLATNMESLVAISNAIFGTAGGPVTATYLLGMLYKRATKWGVFFGILVGFTMGCWVVVGAVIYADELDEVLRIYSLSFMWYSTWSCSITIICGILFSEIHRLFSKTERELSKNIDPALLATCLRPKDWKSITKYKIDDEEEEEEEEDKDGKESEKDEEAEIPGSTSAMTITTMVQSSTNDDLQNAAYDDGDDVSGTVLKSRLRQRDPVSHDNLGFHEESTTEIMEDGSERTWF
ncbi:putative sodium-dependent multivitamin transporter [Ptychodera flava]|uniref:putative sodium-dependent multivitamin transporter n=1 Tax=Ptychodera flava TaxID=63121 RepID=UPI00396A7B15